LIDKILDKVAKYIKDTELIIRSDNNKIFRIAYLVQRSSIFQTISILAIFANAVVLGMIKYPVD